MKAWQDWRTALIVVRPDTVVRWHRQWLRRRWTQHSTRIRPGRHSTTAPIRTLVGQMAEANPLWGAPRIHGDWASRRVLLQGEMCSRVPGSWRLTSSLRTTGSLTGTV